eukprot:jgi/Botrbrau1/2336/Bobra.39_1s0025.1
MQYAQLELSAAFTQSIPNQLWIMKYALLCMIIAIVQQSRCNGAEQSGNPNWLFPGAKVAENSFRLTALGTGTPHLKKEQAATGFLLQLGNGENFLFDLGTGSSINLIGLGIPFSTLDKIFLSHLHSDHIGDLPALATAGAVFNRTSPLHIYGPSSDTPDKGTAETVQGLQKFLSWDSESRRRVNLVGRHDDGDKLITHEFDYAVRNQVVYESNGVRIISTPVDHYFTPGPVAYRVEWNDLVFTYSGDSRPVETLLELARGSDLLLHEAVGPIRLLEALSPPERATMEGHFTPAQAGEAIAQLRPRLAVLFHLNLDDVSIVPILTEVRKGYPTGPLAIAKDLDAFEVSKHSIVLKKWVIPSSFLGWWGGGPFTFSDENSESLDTSSCSTDTS